MTKSQLPDDVSATDLAMLLGVDARTIRNYASRGLITRSGHGLYPLKRSIRALLADREQARQPGPEEIERARLLRAKAEAAERENAVRAGSLISLSTALAVVDRVVGLYTVTLSVLPIRVAGKDLTLRSRLEEETYRIREEVAAAATEIATKEAEADA